MLLIVLAAGVASCHSPLFRFSSTGPPRLNETGRLTQRTQTLQRLRGGGGIILAEELQLCLSLLEAAVLGSVIGVERGWAGRPAGIRTMSMVCMGAALFTGVTSSSNRTRPDLNVHPSPEPAPLPTSLPGVGKLEFSDSARAAAQVASGVGFIGAGVVQARGPNHQNSRQKHHGDDSLKGLTTAAAIWLVAGVRRGLAAGCG